MGKFKLKSGNNTSYRSMGNSPMQKYPSQASSFKDHDGPHYADNYSVGTTSGQGASSTGYTDELPPPTIIQKYTGKKSRQGDREFTSRYLNESYGGTNHNQTPYGPGNPADLSHLIRTNFPRKKNGKLTREGRKQQQAHLDYIKRKSVNPTRADLKDNRMVPQLTARQADKGYTQVQDPTGAYHIILPNGELKSSGNFGYSRESRDWKRGFKENPVTGPPVVEPPPVTTEGPPVTTEGPPVTTEGPPVTTEGPPVTTEGPPVTTEGPPVTTEGPPVTTEGPPVTEGTFGEAFKAARAGKKKTFTYKGEEFHSRQADETPDDWNSNMGGGEDVSSPGAKPSDGDGDGDEE